MTLTQARRAGCYHSQMRTDTNAVAEFIETVWAYYRAQGRHELPWRRPEPDNSFDPYRILVSEFMLQQTQVSRVIPKFEAFVRQFPTIPTLAKSELGDVLRAWQGLGYNRRAKYLWQTAQAIESAGAFPEIEEQLIRLPGVGVNTAGAIRAYAFNLPALFVETNIRTVYIHHFTRDDEIISDDFIRDYLGRTIDQKRPREFYWALMDYGTFLKTQIQNTQRSKHYAKQSRFTGSRRQVRGLVLRELSAGPASVEQLAERISDGRLGGVLGDLEAEGLIKKIGKRYRL
jgi:A/G-specific adenine glycosylase